MNGLISTRSPKEIDAHIMACPYFSGKNLADRRAINGEMTHMGSCGLEFHYEKVCPSDKCLCAEILGFKGFHHAIK